VRGPQKKQLSAKGWILYGFSQLKQAGLVPAYVRENLTVLAAFGRRLERWKLRVEDLNEDVVDRFLRKHYPKRRLPRHVRPTLHRLLSMLRESGATPFGLAASLPNPARQLTNKYRHFPTEERGILSSTACRWCPTFSTERFESGVVDHRSS
jgi:hypothetical protein